VALVDLPEDLVEDLVAVVAGLVVAVRLEDGKQ